MTPSQRMTPSSPDSPPINLEALHRIHLMGIAGTGMGAFARLLQQAGYEVQGSDKGVWPPMSELLEQAGIAWMEGFAAENLNPPPDLVVVGNVIRRVNEEATALRALRLPHLSFPEALGALFLKQRKALVVAGTHGKTTTTTLLAHLLTQVGADPSFLIGGVGQNFGDSARLGEGKHFVLEGDEYDTAYFDKGPKFLHYQAQSLIFSSMEFDHADIYRDLAHYRTSFEHLMGKLPSDGFVAACGNDPAVVEVARQAACEVLTYSARAPGELPAGATPAEFVAQSIVASGPFMEATLVLHGETLGRVRLHALGLHNLENALGAMAVALHEGYAFDALKAGLECFEGVRRRQELLGTPAGVTVIDDFAHHPTAVRETLAAVRAGYPEARLWAVFEPRSNTARRNIYQAAYAEAFDAADQILIASPPPHPDAIPESERFDPAQLAEALASRGLQADHLPEADSILQRLLTEVAAGDVVLIMSNGAFVGLPRRLSQALSARD